MAMLPLECNEALIEFLPAARDHGAWHAGTNRDGVGSGFSDGFGGLSIVVGGMRCGIVRKIGGGGRVLLLRSGSEEELKQSYIGGRVGRRAGGAVVGKIRFVSGRCERL